MNVTELFKGGKKYSIIIPAGPFGRGWHHFGSALDSNLCVKSVHRNSGFIEVVSLSFVKDNFPKLSYAEVMGMGGSSKGDA